MIGPDHITRRFLLQNNAQHLPSLVDVIGSSILTKRDKREKVLLKSRNTPTGKSRTLPYSEVQLSKEKTHVVPHVPEHIFSISPPPSTLKYYDRVVPEGQTSNSGKPSPSKLVVGSSDHFPPPLAPVDGNLPKLARSLIASRAASCQMENESQLEQSFAKDWGIFAKDWSKDWRTQRPATTEPRANSKSLYSSVSTPNLHSRSKKKRFSQTAPRNASTSYRSKRRSNPKSEAKRLSEVYERFLRENGFSGKEEHNINWKKKPLTAPEHLKLLEEWEFSQNTLSKIIGQIGFECRERSLLMNRIVARNENIMQKLSSSILYHSDKKEQQQHVKNVNYVDPPPKKESKNRPTLVLKIADLEQKLEDAHKKLEQCKKSGEQSEGKFEVVQSLITRHVKEHNDALLARDVREATLNRELDKYKRALEEGGADLAALQARMTQYEGAHPRELFAPKEGKQLDVLVVDRIPYDLTETQIKVMLEPMGCIEFTKKISKLSEADGRYHPDSDPKQLEYLVFAKFPDHEKMKLAMQLLAEREVKKTTSMGTIIVKLDAFDANEFPTSQLTVHGKGVPRATLKTIFERYGRIKNFTLAGGWHIVTYKRRVDAVRGIMGTCGRKISWRKDGKEGQTILDVSFANDTAHITYESDEDDSETAAWELEEATAKLADRMDYVEYDLARDRFPPEPLKKRKMRLELQSRREPPPFAECERLLNIVEELKTRVCISEEELSRLKKIAKQHPKIRHLRKTLEQNDPTPEDLEEMLETKRKELKITKKKLRASERENDTLKNDYESEKARVINATKTFNSRLRMIRRTKRRVVAGKGGSLSDSNGPEYVENMLRSRVVSLESRLREMRSNRNSTHGILIKTDMNESSQKMAEAYEEIKQLKTIVQEKELELKKAKRTLRKLKLSKNDNGSKPNQQLRISSDEVNTLTNKQQYCREKIEQLRGYLADVCRKLSTLCSENNASGMEKTSRKKNDLTRKLDKIQGELEGTEDGIMTLRQKIATEIARLNILLANLDGVPIKPNDPVDSNVQSLHQDLEKKIINQEMRASAVEGQYLEKADLMGRQVVRLKAEVERLNEQIMELKAVKDRQEREFHKKLDAKARALEKTARALDREKSKCEKNQVELAELRRKEEMFNVFTTEGDDATKMAKIHKKMSTLMKERDNAVESSAKLQNQKSNFLEKSSKWEQTEKDLVKIIEELTRENRAQENELARIDRAERVLDINDKHDKVEESIQRQKKKLERMTEVSKSPIKRPQSPESPKTEGIEVTITNQRKLTRQIEQLKVENTRLERELKKLRLTKETLPDPAYSPTQFYNRQLSAESRISTRSRGGGTPPTRSGTPIQGSIDVTFGGKPLILGGMEKPTRKEARNVDKKWRMTPSRFQEILSGEHSKRPVKALRWIKRIIGDIYELKYTTDQNCERENRPLMKLPEFIYHDYIPARFGIKALVDVMCWDIHNSVSHYYKDDEETAMFKKFLEEDYNLQTLRFYLRARHYIEKSVSVLEDNLWIHAPDFLGILEHIFECCTHGYRFHLAERLEIFSHKTEGEPRVGIHKLLTILIDEDLYLRRQFRSSVELLFFRMGLHKLPCLNMSDYIPAFRVILEGLPEAKISSVVSMISKPRFAKKQNKILEFVSLCRQIRRFKVQFELPYHLFSPATMACSPHSNSLCLLIDHRWRNSESAIFTETLHLFGNIHIPYEQSYQIRRRVERLKDLGIHLGMAINNKLGWEAFYVYNEILSVIQKIFDFHEFVELFVSGSNPVKPIKNLLIATEEAIYRRYTKISKKARQYCNAEVHKKPRYVIHPQQLESNALASTSRPPSRTRLSANP